MKEPMSRKGISSSSLIHRRLENDETAQKIVVANNQANMINAESQLENAERTLKEFEKGLFQQELTLIEGEVFVAQESVERSLAKLDHSQRLAASGFLSSVQLNADRFQWEKAKRDLKAAELKLTVYREFTREKLLGEYLAAIKQNKAQVEAAQSTLDLATSRLVEIQEQIKKCRILAPAQGQVVYADDERRNIIIEEGAIIRDNQVVVRLPDIQNMEVAVRINESHINRVVAGQLAKIELDADPDNPLDGEVNEVAAYPFPLRWHGAPLEYDTKVTNCRSSSQLATRTARQGEDLFRKGTGGDSGSFGGYYSTSGKALLFSSGWGVLGASSYLSWAEQ